MGNIDCKYPTSREENEISFNHNISLLEKSTLSIFNNNNKKVKKGLTTQLQPEKNHFNVNIDIKKLLESPRSNVYTAIT